MAGVEDGGEGSASRALAAAGGEQGYGNESSPDLENTSSTDAELRALQQEMDNLPPDMTMPQPMTGAAEGESEWGPGGQADALGDTGVPTVSAVGCEVYLRGGRAAWRRGSAPLLQHCCNRLHLWSAN